MKRRIAAAWMMVITLAVAGARAEQGAILSSIASDEPQVYGLDIREEGGMTMLYVVVQHGMVYRYGINAASAAKDGSRVAYDSKFLMTGTNQLEGLTGLAVCYTYEGPYATEFIGHMGIPTWNDDRSWRSRWGVDNYSPGNLKFDQLGSGLRGVGDIAPISPSVSQAGVWTTIGTDLLKYNYPGWGSTPAADYNLAASLSGGATLTGVTLGVNDNELWLLTTSREILQVSVASGSAVVLSRFTLSDTINNPQGLVFDRGGNTLWVSNMDYGPNPIYQISLGMPVLGVSPASRHVGCHADQATFDVTNSESLSMAWTAQVTDGADWLSIVNTTGTDNDTVTVNIAENTGSAVRTGTIRISAPGATGSPQDVTIVQAKPPVQAGDILSFFSTGLAGTDGSVYGLAIRAVAEGTELHAAVGLHGAVYKFSVDPVAAITDGGEGAPADVQRMTDPAVNITYLKGLAMPATSEGMYATQYIASQDNEAMYRTRWAVDGNPGNLTWGLINGAWSLNTNADICEISRTDTAFNMGIWSTSGTKLYRYPSCSWGAAADTVFDLGTSLNGVALGQAGDLWVLTADHRILQVNSATGAVTRQFALAAEITQPSGIEYDARAGALWIGNLADNNIYQVAIDQIKVTVQGTIDLPGFAGDMTTVPVTIEIRNPGEVTPVEVEHVFPDAGGNFAFATAQKGVFDLAATAPNWLRQVQTGIDTTNGAIVNFSLKGGDANGDNQVTFEDFAVLQNYYGQSVTPGATGDFNGDGKVSFADFSILQNSYGDSGAATASAPAAATTLATLPCGGVGVLLLAGLGLSLLFLRSQD